MNTNFSYHICFVFTCISYLYSPALIWIQYNTNKIWIYSNIFSHSTVANEDPPDCAEQCSAYPNMSYIHFPWIFHSWMCLEVNMLLTRSSTVPPFELPDTLSVSTVRYQTISVPASVRMAQIYNILVEDCMIIDASNAFAHSLRRRTAIVLECVALRRQRQSMRNRRQKDSSWMKG
jgi:hypothetical protein